MTKNLHFTSNLKSFAECFYGDLCPFEEHYDSTQHPEEIIRDLEHRSSYQRFAELPLSGTRDALMRISQEGKAAQASLFLTRDGETAPTHAANHMLLELVRSGHVDGEIQETTPYKNGVPQGEYCQTVNPFELSLTEKGAKLLADLSRAKSAMMEASFTLNGIYWAGIELAAAEKQAKIIKEHEKDTWPSPAIFLRAGRVLKLQKDAISLDLLEGALGVSRSTVITTLKTMMHRGLVSHSYGKYELNTLAIKIALNFVPGQKEG